MTRLLPDGAFDLAFGNADGGSSMIVYLGGVGLRLQPHAHRGRDAGHPHRRRWQHTAQRRSECARPAHRIALTRDRIFATGSIRCSSAAGRNGEQDETFASIPRLCASALCCIALSVHAGDGDLDTTFNGTGIQILEGPTDELDIQVVGGCIDSDDRVLVAAFVYDPLGGEARDFLVARWREDGTPDTDFSSDGQMQVGFENGFPQGCTMAQDGRIVVFGDAGAGRNASGDVH